MGAVSFFSICVNSELYLRSLSLELQALRNRVRNFIDDAHWQTDGEWKESVLRHFLERNLPNTVKVGRGFVVSREGASSQIDVLIYDTARPVLFRDGDLVFITPDAARAVIEVKSRVNNTSFKKAVQKLTKNISFICKHRRYRTVFGVFAFESSVTSKSALAALQASAGSSSRQVIDIACLGSSHLLHWWPQNPEDHRKTLKRWHSYKLRQGTAPGYFLHNIVEFVAPESVRENSQLWFPACGKEGSKDGEIDLMNTVVPNATN